MTTVTLDPTRATAGEPLAPKPKTGKLGKSNVEKVSIDTSKTLQPEIQKLEAQEKRSRLIGKIAGIATVVFAVAYFGSLVSIAFFLPAAFVAFGTGFMTCSCLLIQSNANGNAARARRRIEALQTLKAAVEQPDFAKFLRDKKIKQKEFTIDELKRLNYLFKRSRALPETRKEALSKIRNEAKAIKTSLAAFQ